MSLAFDHVFCVVDDLEEAAERAIEAGWVLDRGSDHPGQGTRNRRLPWAEHYLELLQVTDHDEAARNRLRLDRRADWRITGASPFGIGLRGQLPEQHRSQFWLYDDLGVQIWAHHDNEQMPQRPLVFALELTTKQLQQRAVRAAAAGPRTRQTTSAIRHLQLIAPQPARLPPHKGPQITHTPGVPHLHVDAGEGPPRAITDTLTINSVAPPRHTPIGTDKSEQVR
jgi:Glyoxalase-like domain